MCVYVSQEGCTFGVGDTRAAVDRGSYYARRSQLGATKEIIDFLEEFMHCQMFERFCDERIRSRGRDKGDMDFFDLACCELRGQCSVCVCVCGGVI